MEGIVSLTKRISLTDNSEIWQGIWGNEDVMVRRFARRFEDKAKEEMKFYLRKNAEYVLRYFCSQMDDTYVYLIFEKPECNLFELINACQQNTEVSHINPDRKAFLNSVKQEFPLWVPSPSIHGQQPLVSRMPTHVLLTLVRDILKALSYFHSLELDLSVNPHDILVFKRERGKGLRAKLATTIYKAAAWESKERFAYELVTSLQRMQANMFSAGLVVYFCLAGSHPSSLDATGEVTDVEAWRKKVDQGGLNSINKDPVILHPDAFDLVQKLLSSKPSRRPPAFVMIKHPIFWSGELNLYFLIEFNALLRDFPSSGAHHYLNSSCKRRIISNNNSFVDGQLSWHRGFPPDLITQVEDYLVKQGMPKLNQDLPTELIKFMRNVLMHLNDYEGAISTYYKLPQNSLTAGFAVHLFLRQFPWLIVESWNSILQYHSKDARFRMFTDFITQSLNNI